MFAQILHTLPPFQARFYLEIKSGLGLRLDSCCERMNASCPGKLRTMNTNHLPREPKKEKYEP